MEKFEKFTFHSVFTEYIRIQFYVEFQIPRHAKNFYNV